MPADQTSNKRPEPTIGIITALPKEYAAVRTMIDGGRDYSTKNQQFVAQYYLGEMPAAEGGKHLVVLALAVTMGMNVAAVWATNLTRDFPTVRTIIMVGIAGGVPNPDNPDEHVRLGDVVVSSEKGVVQYDFVKQEVERIIPRHSSDRPSAMLLQAAKRLEADDIRGQRSWVKLFDRAKKVRGATRPKDKSDVLHKFTKDKTGHPSSKVVPHPLDPNRHPGEPRVFIGPIASANTLQKDPFKRDDLRKAFNVKAVEMESSGIADATWIQGVDYLVVRGICDYCDPKKNDLWQGYAAVVAAAYTRALLEMMSPSDLFDSDQACFG
jgi:nucleoside phosphorylase